MRRTMCWLPWVAMAAAAGCAPSAMDLPPNFVPVQDDPTGVYVKRAVSADGVVIALRTADNPKEGTLDFWSQAAGNELTGGKGYKLVSTEPVKSDAGVPGTLMTFSAEQRGTNLTYLLAVFVKGQTILLVEAGGKDEAFKPRAEQVRKAMLTAR